MEDENRKTSQIPEDDEPDPRAGKRISVATDEKTKFALSFSCAVSGFSQKRFVENALSEKMKSTKLPDGTNWLDYWDPDPGVRNVKLLYAHDEYPKSAEDDATRLFINAHRDFFFDGDELRRDYIAVLWPRLDEFLDAWRKGRAVNAVAAHLLMLKATQDAGLPPLRADPSQRY